MAEALRFFVDYQYMIYAALVALAILGIRKFMNSWEEVRGAAFGLERESAQSRLNRAAVIIVLVLIMAITEFVLVSFVVPSVPGARPLMTPTIDLLATPSITLPAPVLTFATTNTPAPDQTLEPTPAGLSPDSGCVPGKLMITEPLNGDQVQGKITLVGTVDILNFGHYEYEVARPNDPIWLTIQAGREIRHEEPLGELDTSTLPPGQMQVRLVAYDNQGSEIGSCTIGVYVMATGP